MDVKDVLEGKCFLVFEADEDLEDKMNTNEAFLESKAKISSIFLSRSFDIVMIMYFI